MKKLFPLLVIIAVIVTMFACSWTTPKVDFTVNATPWPTPPPPTPTDMYWGPPAPTLTPGGHSISSIISWQQLEDVMYSDPTNQNTWNQPTNYMCVEFSMDFVSNMHALGYDAWVVSVDFQDPATGQQVNGHAFVGVPVIGPTPYNEHATYSILYMEPQGDVFWAKPVVGAALCRINDPHNCMPAGKSQPGDIILAVDNPAICDRATNQCKQDPNIHVIQEYHDNPK